MEKLNDGDLELISKAKEIITKNFDYEKNNHTVGAAIRCKNGNIYVGVNIYFNHGACAETIAIGSAITAGEREFDSIVAVGSEGDILPPCGNCRQMLFDYAPFCNVIISTGVGDRKLKITEMIPFAYVRKIL